jgi:hypothetical protein
MLGEINMAKKIPKRVIKMAWPILQFFIVNFGREIVLYVMEQLQTMIKAKKRKEMEEALNKAQDAENAANTAENEEDKLKYYEIAKLYREEAERKKQFLQEFMHDLDDSVIKLTESVQEKAKQIDINDVFGIEGSMDDIKVIDSDDKEIKIKKKKKRKKSLE